MAKNLGMYILDKEGNAVLEEEIPKWGKFMNDSEARKVANYKSGDGVEVSTVFLGLDHSFGSGLPVLWETLVFGGELNGEMNRYTSKEDAIAGHKEMVNKVIHYDYGKYTGN